MRKGEWVKMPFDDDLSCVEMGFGKQLAEEPTEWTPAFIDGPHAQARLPELNSGGWYVWLRRGGVASRVGQVTVE